MYTLLELLTAVCCGVELDACDNLFSVYTEWSKKVIPRF